MKTPRERIMTFVALGLITLTLGGLIYFMYYDRNLSALRARERTIQSKLDDEEFALAVVEKGMPRLKLDKRMSLPADPKVASREYVAGLLTMFKESGYAPGKVTPNPKAIDTRAAAPGKNKLPYTVLTVDITAPGDLSMLSAFLERFYRAPLLHRIKSLRVAKPITSTREQGPGELEVKMTVEALILDGAENRKTLYSTGIKEADRPKPLARTTSQYASISGHNIFFGLGPRDSGDADERIRPDYNILPDTWLDSITIDDKGIVATIWDSANEFQYVIRKRYEGAYKVDRYYFIKDVRKRDFGEVGKDKLELKDANDFLHRSFNVLRVDATDVYLGDGDKVFQLHAGWRLSEIKALTRAEATKLGLSAKSEKKDDKTTQKGEDKKDSKETTSKEAAKKDEGR